MQGTGSGSCGLGAATDPIADCRTSEEGKEIPRDAAGGEAGPSGTSGAADCCGGGGRGLHPWAWRSDGPCGLIHGASYPLTPGSDDSWAERSPAEMMPMVG